ncbi:Vacuolar protein sorting-associated protein 33A [Chamberlinius hualienensis]
MQREFAGNEPQMTSQFDALILIDREVDLLTPLLTQVTYEGLIDEFFGINDTIVKLPPEKFLKANDESQDLPTEYKPFVLNSGEELFAEIRDHNFSAATQIIIKKLKAYTVEFEETKKVNSVPEIKKVAAKLPKMHLTKQSLSNHMSIAELITESYNTNEFLENVHIENEFLNIIDTDKPSPFIEECIAKQKPLLQVLRLMCIQSITNSGLKQKLLDYYKKEIIQSYGYQHVLTLQNLESVGLLRVQEQKRPYTILRKNFQLTLEEGTKTTSNQISYESSGYAPMSVRLAQHFSRSTWRSISDLLRLLPGMCFEETQQVPLGLRKRRGSVSSIQSSTDEQKVTLVFFLGGCTYSEISSLRYLSTQDDYPTEYVIGTTKIINGSTFIQSLKEHLPSSQS